MRYKRVLLVRPSYKRSHYEYAGLPAGLGYVSEALDNANIEQEVVDMFLGYNYSHLKKRLKEFKPDLVGITMMSFRHKDHYALADKIKQDANGADIIAGGPHISTVRTKVLDDCKAINYGATLEGEDLIVELCNGNKDLKDIKGLLYGKNGQVSYTGDRDFITDLDKRGFPKYRFFEKDKYPKYISLLTSRGCPHSCIFCPVQLTIGKKLRIRSPYSVVDEVEHWYKNGVKIFNIVDDNFTFYKQRILDICEDIKNRSIKDTTFVCRNGIRADTVDREMLIAMKGVGFNYLAFGVESGSEKILKVLKKGEALSDIDKAVKEASNLGYMVSLSFILGSPYETKEDVDESLKFATKYPVFDVRFYNLIPFPGTELYDWIVKNDYFDKTQRDYLNAISHWVNNPIFGTPEMPISLRKKLYRQLNRKIKSHTFKTKLLFSSEMESLFSKLGIPAALSKILARLYYTRLFQSLIVNSGIASMLKNLLKRRRKEK